MQAESKGNNMDTKDYTSTNKPVSCASVIGKSALAAIALSECTEGRKEGGVGVKYSSSRSRLLYQPRNQKRHTKHMAALKEAHTVDSLFQCHNHNYS